MTYYEFTMSCIEKLHGVHRSIRCIFVVSLASLTNFAESEVHLTAIQALSNHKQEYGGQLKSIQLYGPCSWRDLLKSGFWQPFSPISGHKTSQFGLLS